MSSAYFRHFWNYILLEVTALILIPTPQHISALTPFWFIYRVYYQSPIQSIKAGIQTHAHVWIMHTNTHQGREDNCYGLDHSSNIWQLIGKEAHSHQFLYLDFCLTPVVVWLLETKWIETASEIPWKRLGQGISAFLIPSHENHIYGLSELTVPLLAPVHTGIPEKHQQPTPDSHVKQMLQTEQYRELKLKGKPKHKPQLQPGLGTTPT